MLQKIITEKYIISVKSFSFNKTNIDIKSLIFLIDDSNDININNIIPEEIIMFTSLQPDITSVKFNTQLLIKYLIHNINNFKENTKLKDIMNSNVNIHNIPFFGYFEYLYHNIVSVENKYIKINNIKNKYIYFTDINYL